MELASVLAGQPWSDHPRCTHPVIGALARAVNDRSTDEGRRSLARHVPSVIGLDDRGLGTTAALVLFCAGTGLLLDPVHQRLAAAHAEAVRRLEVLASGGRMRRWWLRILESDFRARGSSAARDAAALVAPYGDRALGDLLQGIVSAYRAATAPARCVTGPAGARAPIPTFEEWRSRG